MVRTVVKKSNLKSSEGFKKPSGSGGEAFVKDCECGEFQSQENWFFCPKDSKKIMLRNVEVEI